MEKHMVVKEESIRSSSGLNSCGLMMVERVKKRGGGGWVWGVEKKRGVFIIRKEGYEGDGGQWNIRKYSSNPTNGISLQLMNLGIERERERVRERERERERERGRVSVGLQKERVELLTAATHKTECLFTNTKRCTWLLSSVLSGLLTFVNYIYISFTPSSNFFLFTFLSVWTNLSFSTFALIIIIIILTSKYRFRELILFISEFN